MPADGGRATMRPMQQTAGNRFAARAVAARAATGLAFALLAGCGATQFEAQSSIPTPLVTKIPVVVGLYIAPEFRDKVYSEKRDGGDYAIAIGKAQSEGFARLMDAMFDRVIPVAGTDAGARTDPQIRGVIEPVLEDFAFVTPVDSGSDVYAVSLKYRITGYRPDGQVIDSWTFTGYGAAANKSMLGGGSEVLKKAVQLAMRDAGAKLATEFREQAVVRGLLPAVPGAETEAPVEVAPPPH
jgi:hypothetical protein